MTSVAISATSAPAAPAVGAETLLEIQGLTKHFGGVRALTDVSFTAEKNTVTALIGPNGAGKTTLYNAITGFLRPDSGRVHFRGTRIDQRAPHQIARLGMVRTFQSIRMFNGLTVYESLLVARPREHRWSTRKSAAKVASLLERMQLADVADRVCSDLPLLYQRRLEVARALMTDPRMILLDEPSAGATVPERQLLVELIAGLKEDGTTVMVIEHNVPFVMQVSDRIVVLHFGEKVAEGTPAEVAENPVVQEIYLGGEASSE